MRRFLFFVRARRAGGERGAVGEIRSGERALKRRDVPVCEEGFRVWGLGHARQSLLYVVPINDR